MLKGIAVSSGVVIGKVYKYVQPVVKLKETQGLVADELAIFEKAIKKTIADIEGIKTRASKSLAAEELAIFDAHLMMANDPEYQGQIKELIESGMNADKATKTVSDQMIEMFESMEDAYFKERAADIRDVCFRLLCNLLGLTIPDLGAIDEQSIVVAHDLTPSDTAALNKEFVQGFITEIGGRTSHSAIMARSLEIPAVVGTNTILSEVENGDMVVLDALKGEIIVKPSTKEIEIYQAKAEAYRIEQEELKALINEPSVSADGHQVEIAGNIGTPADAQGVIDFGGDSIGLYRTEFLYMNSKDGFPTEEQQFNAYKAVLEAMHGKRVVVRTLDIGGDKKLDYFEFPKEMNPFLGYRAIRLCLDRQDIFRTQLRALIRASVYGKLSIMFPMIATINEFKEAKAIYEEEKTKLINEGIKVSDEIEVGMMVEIPAAAALADQFAKYSDFFSIGTNDLIQYSMAADRMSQTVAYLYQPMNPSLLRLIKSAIDGAHKYGKWCGMCGEMASDPLCAPLLLGLGLDEFSVSATSILKVRKMIKSLSKTEMETMASQALNLETAEQVNELVKEKLGL